MDESERWTEMSGGITHEKIMDVDYTLVRLAVRTGLGHWGQQVRIETARLRHESGLLKYTLDRMVRDIDVRT